MSLMYCPVDITTVGWFLPVSLTSLLEDEDLPSCTLTLSWSLCRSRV